MNRRGPATRLAALATAVVLVFALAGSGVGTDARLVDSEVVAVPVVVFGTAPDDPQSGLVGTPLTLTFERLTSETADWPAGFAAVADETAAASFAVASADAAGETNESTELSAEPVYVVRLDGAGPDGVHLTFAGGEQTAATVAIDGALLAGALGLSTFDPAVVELRIDGVVTGYDTTAGGAVQFRTADWADRTVAFRVAETDAPASDTIVETQTATGEDPEPTTEPSSEAANGTTEAPAEETPTEVPTETPSDGNSTETTTEEAPAAETPTETPSEQTPTETAPTETTESSESTEETTTESSESTEPTDTGTTQPPAEAGE
jgi:hypothetical protein